MPSGGSAPSCRLRAAFVPPPATACRHKSAGRPLSEESGGDHSQPRRSSVQVGLPSPCLSLFWRPRLQIFRAFFSLFSKSVRNAPFSSMDGWQGYVKNLMDDGNCQDCAIVGYGESKGVWAAHPEGALKNITPQEIDTLVGKDRQTFFTSGLTLGSQKCSVIRDRFEESDDCTMDIRTKSQGGEPTYNISVGKSGKALVIVEGKEAVHGGVLNTKAIKMAEYLKTSGY